MSGCTSWLMETSKRTRRKDVITIKNKIKQYKRKYKADFYTEVDLGHVFNEIMMFAHIYFISDKYTDIFYYTNISTAQIEFMQKVEHKALMKIHDILNAKEPNSFPYTSWSHGDLYTAKYMDTPIPELDDMTIFAYSDELEEKYYNNPTSDITTVNIGYQLSHSCDYGVCLSMVVDEPVLNIDVINKHIKEFLKNEDEYLTKLKAIPAHTKNDKYLNGDMEKYHVVIDTGVANPKHFIYDKNWDVESVFKYGSPKAIAVLIGDDVYHTESYDEVEDMVACGLEKYKKYLDKYKIDKNDVANEMIKYIEG